jgi:sugar phosphate isomerase/epimerase
LKKVNFKLIIGVYSCWTDYEGLHEYKPVEEHLTQYRQQLTNAKVLNPFHINAHSGSDSFTDEEAIEFFAGAIQIEEELGLTVSHETHRGRALYNPFRTLMLVNKFPKLKLTLDFSHFVLVCERRFDEHPKEIEMINKIASQTWHIHARVGYNQHAQIADLNDQKHERDVKAHERVWREVWKHDHGREYRIVTPEYGPEPYQVPTGDKDSEKLWNLCNEQLRRLREEF